MAYVNSHLRKRSNQASGTHQDFPQSFTDPFAPPPPPRHYSDFYSVDFQNEKELVQLPALPDAEKARVRRKRWIIAGVVLGLLAITLSTVLATLYVKAKHEATSQSLNAAQNNLASTSPSPSSSETTTTTASSSSTIPTPTALAFVSPKTSADVTSTPASSASPTTSNKALTTFSRTTKKVQVVQTTSSSTEQASPSTSTVAPLSTSVMDSPTSSSSSSASSPAASADPSPSSSSPSAPSPSPSPPSPSSSSSTFTSTFSSSSLYTSQTYSGVATHFPGSQLATSALACGDSYTSPSTTLFAALCHDTFDSFPGTTANEIANSNRAPTCGEFVDGRKDLTGNWVAKGNGVDYVVVGGDGKLNCVGTEGVRCHKPRTVALTYRSKTVRNIMIVDRNQGLGASPCAPGDIDVSDLVYRTLAGTTTSDTNAGLSSELKGITWVWE